jgi:GNAT superfamily N-acetyltransferase
VSVELRPLSVDDADALAVIERLASQPFRDAGYPNVADDDPFTVDELAPYAAGGRGWVAIDETGAAIGYVLADVVDGSAHIEQVTVHPRQQGNGVGRLLIERVASWAADCGMPAVTLTTFTDVPWNRPLYEHLGFAVLGETDIGPQLRQLRDVEGEHGLDPAVRVCMRLVLVASETPTSQGTVP